MNPLPLAVLLHALPLNTHPTLYYDASDVDRLRNPATPEARALHDALVAGADAAGTDPANYEARFVGGALSAFALDCAVTGDATVCGNARRWLSYVMNLSEWNVDAGQPLDFPEAANIAGVSVAYDVLTDPSPALPASARLSASEADAVRTRLAAEAERMYDATAAGSSPEWWSGEYIQNHNWVNVSSLGVAAIVLNGEISPDPTCRWLDAALDDFQNVGTVLGRIADGTWHEGYSYEGSSVSGWLDFVVAFARARRPGGLSCPRAASTPDLADNPWFRAFPHFRALSSLPGREHQSVLLHGDFFGWSADPVGYALRFAASHFRDGEAEWLARLHAAAQPPTTYGFEQAAVAMEYLALDPGVQPAQPAAVDLYLSDLQGEVSRSGYDANAAVLAVKAGAFGGVSNWLAASMGDPLLADVNFGHDHDDDLGFWFYADGQWLAPEADGYALHGYCTAMGSPPVWNASYHNTLTVDDVGQWGDDEPCRDSADHHVPWSRLASVAAHAETRDFVYTAMDGTALYPDTLGLDTVSRQVLFLDRRCVVTRDTLHASAPHTYYWHDHALNDVVLDGDWLRAESLNDRALGIRVVAPASGEWAYEVSSDSPPHGPNADVYIDPDLDITHVQVHPTSPAQGARFLMVMCPTTVSGWDARPDVQPLGDVSLARGFSIHDGAKQGRWLFGDGRDSMVDNGAMQLTGVLGGVETGAGGATTYVLVRGTQLSDGGQAVLSGDARDGAIEATVSGGTVDVSATGATTARVLAPGATAARWNGRDVGFTRDGMFVVLPATTSGTDGGVAGGDAGSSGGGDGGVANDGGSPAHADQGCGCAVPAGRRGTGGGALALAAIAAVAARRRGGRSR